MEISKPANWDPKFNDEQAKYLKNYFDRQKGSPLASLPMICKWSACHYKASCPLYAMQIDPSPINKPCPIEQTIIDNLIADYCKELDIQPEDITDLAVLKEMVHWNIMEKRAQEELAEDPKIIREAVVGVDDEGVPIMREIMNPIINMMEKSGRMKQKLRDSLIATREAKDKSKSRKQLSITQIAASIQAKIAAKKNNMIDATPIKQIETEPAKPQDPEIKTFDPTLYIEE